MLNPPISPLLSTILFSSSLLISGLALPNVASAGDSDHRGGVQGTKHKQRRAKNVILFVGDGMGISTVSATRVFSVGVDGELVLDQLPHTALSRTADADHLTPDSASTMTAMMTGYQANSGVVGFGSETEQSDFNQDGDGPPLMSLSEKAKRNGMRVGVVSTARVAHATPAACYAHVNNRSRESAIAAQALPGDSTYNRRLGSGLDLLLGGGRQHFVPSDVIDEEGGKGSRTDGRDLREEFQQAGYSYVWNSEQFEQTTSANLPLLGLFERSHMEYEHDRPSDIGGEPSLSEMTRKSIELLENSCKYRRRGYFLMIESGRIDHAHHAGNAWRALTDAEELDKAIGEALSAVDLRETLVLVTADHSHVFTMAGYPLRPIDELGYDIVSAPEGYTNGEYSNLFDVVYNVDGEGAVSKVTDNNETPYTVLGYQNGPGYRGANRVDPHSDPFGGFGRNEVQGPEDPNYLQEAAIPLGSETHAGEDVALYGIGARSELVRGTMKNTKVFEIMTTALRLR